MFFIAAGILNANAFARKLFICTRSAIRTCVFVRKGV